MTIEDYETLWKERQEKPEGIQIANKWAENNRGDTMLITVGCLLFSLILGAFLTLGKESDSSDNFLYGVEPVESIFQGMQQIQNAKAYQISQLQQMAQRGQLLKHELDSLVQLPDKSHEDSMQIIIKYKQAEIHLPAGHPAPHRIPGLRNIQVYGQQR